jgi:membrane metallo-endopeptidase-like protein 1
VGFNHGAGDVAKYEGWGFATFHYITNRNEVLFACLLEVLYFSPENHVSSSRHFRSIFLDQPSLGLDREFLVKGWDEKYVQHYFTYMKETAKLFGADLQNERTDKELKDSLLFEMDLANASDADEDRRNATELYNQVVLGEYEVLEGHPTSWVEYINRIISGHTIGDKEVRLALIDLKSDIMINPQFQVVVVQNLNYFKKLSAILQKTSSRTVSNYLVWRTVQSSMDTLNRGASEIRERFNKATSGINADPPRWKKCVKQVGFNSYTGSSFRVAAGSMYIR